MIPPYHRHPLPSATNFSTTSTGTIAHKLRPAGEMPGVFLARDARPESRRHVPRLTRHAVRAPVWRRTGLLRTQIYSSFRCGRLAPAPAAPGEPQFGRRYDGDGRPREGVGECKIETEATVEYELRQATRERQHPLPAANAEQGRDKRCAPLMRFPNGVRLTVVHGGCLRRCLAHLQSRRPPDEDRPPPPTGGNGLNESPCSRTCPLP